MNKIIMEISKEYNTNAKTLKRYVKESGIKPKKASRIQVYVTAPSLLYCRADEVSGMVEYLDINLNIKLCNELREVL